MSAAFATYLTSENELGRRTQLGIWEEASPGKFNFLQSVMSAAALSREKKLGLPNDELTLENCVAGMHSCRVNLFIDPEAQADLWLSGRHQERGL